MKLLTTLFLLFVPINPVQEEKTEFIRVSRDKNGIPTAIETSSVTYKKDTTKVTLIGVIHIGDKDYYNTLNSQFKQYDALLYELVAPEGTIPDKNRDQGTLGQIRKLVGLLLQLDDQLDCINYEQKNFIHADLSPEGMQKALADRGHDRFTLILSILTDFMKQKNMNDIKIRNGQEVKKIDVKKYEHENKAVYFKRIMAESMSQMSENDLGATIGSILIDDRNAACMKVLKEQMNKNKNNIGIFYGAAHMPDFEKRLVQMGFTKQDTNWLKAWDIRPKNPNEILLKLIEEAIK